MMHAQTLDREIFELNLREWVAGVPAEGRGYGLLGGVLGTGKECWVGSCSLCAGRRGRVGGTEQARGD